MPKRMHVHALIMTSALATTGCCEMMRGPLQRATEVGDNQRVQTLLEDGANPNNYTCGRGYPLPYAAHLCNLDAARLLIDAGASTTDIPAELALRNAVRGCSTDVIELLLQRGINPNANYYLGDTILMTAIHRNDVEIVSLLLERSANPEQVGRYEGYVIPRLKETTPLILAASSSWSPP
jgi:ankyrin repeat protein